MTQAKGPVFLSASVPYRRPDHYVADETAVGEAVRALVAEVVPERPLIFGGHPAISPMVWDAASSQGAADNVYIYQSELYRAVIPHEAKFFEAIDRLIWTPLNRPNASRDNPADRMRLPPDVARMDDLPAPPARQRSAVAAVRRRGFRWGNGGS